MWALLWVLLALIGAALLGIVIWHIIWTRDTVDLLEAKDMVLMANVTSLDMRLMDEETARIAKDMILMGNVTDLDNRLVQEMNERIDKDMILMQNVTDLQSMLSMLDNETMQLFMIKMANITTLFDAIEDEETARIAKDMLLMDKDMVLMQNVTDLQAAIDGLDGETVKTILGQEPDGTGNIDLIGGLGVSITTGPGSNDITFENDGLVTLDGVTPDVAGNVDLVGSGSVTITPGASTITIAGDVVSLSNAGTTDLVNDGTGPTLALKGLVAGTNMDAFGISGTDVTINAATTTLANLGTTSLVVDGTGPGMTMRGLLAGTGITFGVSGTDVTINAVAPPTGVSSIEGQNIGGFPFIAPVTGAVALRQGLSISFSNPGAGVFQINNDGVRSLSGGTGFGVTATTGVISGFSVGIPVPSPSVGVNVANVGVTSWFTYASATSPATSGNYVAEVDTTVTINNGIRECNVIFGYCKTATCNTPQVIYEELRRFWNTVGTRTFGGSTAIPMGPSTPVRMVFQCHCPVAPVDNCNHVGSGNSFTFHRVQ